MPEKKTENAIRYTTDPVMEIPNEETIQAMRDTLEGRGISRAYSSFEELRRDLEAEDPD